MGGPSNLARREAPAAQESQDQRAVTIGDLLKGQSPQLAELARLATARYLSGVTSLFGHSEGNVGTPPLHPLEGSVGSEQRAVLSDAIAGRSSYEPSSGG